MKLKVIFGQPRNSYPDQHAPMALEVADEYNYDDYPDYLDGKLQEYRDSSEYTAVVLIEVEVDEAAVRAALSPTVSVPSGSTQVIDPIG